MIEYYSRNALSDRYQLWLSLVILAIMALFSCDDAEPEAPYAHIHMSESRYLQNYILNYKAEIKTGSDPEAFEYSWDFGDGSTEMGPTVSHRYAFPGDYQVALSVVGEGGSDLNTLPISVTPSLELIETFNLQVDEPSGLTFGLDQQTLWTVSDRTGHVYQMDLQGNILQELSFHGNDLEGVSFDSRDSTLWLVSESEAELIHIDTNGVELSSTWIAGVSDGSGLEGIALDPVHSRYFLLKEKDSSALLILNDSLETDTYQRIGFAPDYSGLYYSQSADKLWMLSHEASSIYLTDTAGQLLETYGFTMEQPEGIVYNELTQEFYIVDDSTEKLHLYKFWD